MYAMKSNSTAHIRNAVLIGEASLRRRMISFICDVCDVNRDTYDPGETDKCIPIVAYPFISDRNAARLDHNPMSPVPREPVNTIVERTGKKLRAVIFDGGSLSPDASRTVHIVIER